MRVVIAPDKFKGSLSAISAYGAIANGAMAADKDVKLRLFAMADGGEGTANVLHMHGCRTVQHEVTGPLPGTRVTGEIVILEDGKTAAIDMASAAGFSLLRPEDRDPSQTTSFGVGELIAFAAAADCTTILLGLGGSATCDAGLGAAQALGVPIQINGETIRRPVTGADLHRVSEIGKAAGRFDGLEVICLCDVDNPLHGPDGAAHVFAAQKGATREQVLQLDRGLARVAGLSLFDATRLHMGAAGGLAFGLQHAVDASAIPGAPFIADHLELDRSLAVADLCITGEGRFDETSLRGKVTSEVARRANQAGVPCIVLAGSIDPWLNVDELGLIAMHSLLPGPMTLDEAVEDAFDLLGAAAEQVIRTFIAGRRSA